MLPTILPLYQSGSCSNFNISFLDSSNSLPSSIVVLLHQSDAKPISKFRWFSYDWMGEILLWCGNSFEGGGDIFLGIFGGASIAVTLRTWIFAFTGRGRKKNLRRWREGREREEENGKKKMPPNFKINKYSTRQPWEV